MQIITCDMVDILWIMVKKEKSPASAAYIRVVGVQSQSVVANCVYK